MLLNIIYIFFIDFKGAILEISKFCLYTKKSNLNINNKNIYMNDIQYSQSYTSSLRYSLAKNKLDVKLQTKVEFIFEMVKI